MKLAKYAAAVAAAYLHRLRIFGVCPFEGTLPHLLKWN